MLLLQVLLRYEINHNFKAIKKTGLSGTGYPLFPCYLIFLSTETLIIVCKLK